MSRDFKLRWRAAQALSTSSDGCSDFLSHCLQDFDVAEPEEIFQKLSLLCTDSAPIELWTDFDNTLSAKSGGVWEALRDTLPAVGQAESDMDRKVNLSKEKAGDLTPAEHMAWSRRELGRYVRYGVTEEDILRAVKTINLRPGAQTLLEFCSKVGIDRYIVSTSVANAIELVEGLCSVHVCSNRLQLRDGVVVGWDETMMLHSGNKHMHAAQVAAGYPQSRNSAKIILGDNRHDADIIPGDKALRIRMRGRRGNTAAYLHESFSRSPLSSGFDLVLRTESLMPVVALLRWVVDLRP